VHRGGDLLGHALGAGSFAQLLQADRAEVGHPDGEALAREVQGVAAVPGPQLQHLARPGRPEHPGGPAQRSSPPTTSYGGM
jgi:hypothetical protein